MPSEAMTFDLRYEHFDRKTDYNAIKNRNDLVTSDPFTIEEDAISFLNQKGDRASLEARFDLTPGLALRALDELSRCGDRGSGRRRPHRHRAARAAESAHQWREHRAVSRAA